MTYYTVNYKEQEVEQHCCEACAIEADVTPEIHQALCALHKEWWCDKAEALEALEEHNRH